MVCFAEGKGSGIALESVAAGFPSPAEGYMEGRLDLNEHVVRNPASTFFVRVDGNSMVGAGIFPGDILVIDRSLDAEKNSIVLAVIDGEFTVKRLVYSDGRPLLQAENPDFKPLDNGESGFAVWGVVTHSIRSFTARLSGPASFQRGVKDVRAGGLQ